MFVDPNAAKVVLETAQVKALTMPACQEVGALLGEIANWSRFYITRNMGKIATEWEKSRNGRAISPDEVERILPLLPLAAMQSDEELQSRWAALLESTVTSTVPNDMLPSFGQTLSQINADEAKFLGRLIVAVSAITESNLMVGHQPGELIYDDLLAVYDTALSRPPFHPFEQNPYVDNRDPELMAHANLLIDDLVRLGIISTRVDAITSGGDDDLTETTTFSWYSVSAYGRQFIKAVSHNSAAHLGHQSK